MKYLKYLIVSVIIIGLCGCAQPSNSLNNQDILIDPEEEVKSIEEYIEKLDNIIILPATEDDLAIYLISELGVATTPTTLFIDESATIRNMHDETISLDEFIPLYNSAYNGDDIESSDFSNIIGKSFNMNYLDHIDTELANKKIIFEIYQTTCGHCKTQIKENNVEIINKYKDDNILFIYYFINTDDLQEINDFIKND